MVLKNIEKEALSRRFYRPVGILLLCKMNGYYSLIKQKN